MTSSSASVPDPLRSISSSLYGSSASSLRASSSESYRRRENRWPDLMIFFIAGLELGQVVRREGLRDVEVVVEPVRDRRADAELRLGVQLLDGLGEHVRRRVPDDAAARLGVGGDRLHLGVGVRGPGEVAQVPSASRTTTTALRAARRQPGLPDRGAGRRCGGHPDGGGRGTSGRRGQGASRAAGGAGLHDASGRCRQDLVARAPRVPSAPSGVVAGAGPAAPPVATVRRGSARAVPASVPGGHVTAGAVASLAVRSHRRRCGADAGAGGPGCVGRRPASIRCSSSRRHGPGTRTAVPQARVSDDPSGVERGIIGADAADACRCSRRSGTTELLLNTSSCSAAPTVGAVPGLAGGARKSGRGRHVRTGHGERPCRRARGGGSSTAPR